MKTSTTEAVTRLEEAWDDLRRAEANLRNAASVLPAKHTRRSGVQSLAAVVEVARKEVRRAASNMGGALRRKRGGR